MERLHFRTAWQKVNRQFHLEDALATVKDSRRRPHYPGQHLLIYLLAGFLTGCEGLEGVQRLLRKSPWLHRLLGGPPKTPVADTFVNYGDTVDASTLQALFPPVWRTLQRLHKVPTQVWMAFDGTGMCLKRKKAIAPVYGVAAWLITGPLKGLLGFVRRPGQEGHGTGELTGAKTLFTWVREQYTFLKLKGVVVDALYCNRPFFQQCWDAKIAFICRLRNEEFHLFQDALGLWKGGLFEAVQEQVIRSGSHRYRWRFQEAEGFEAFDPADPPVRVIRLEQVALTVRNEPTGTPEVLWLVTSLPAAELKAEAVLKLMRARWEIEVGAFRTLKHTFHLEPLAPTRPYACEIFWLLGFLAALLLAWFLLVQEAVGQAFEGPLREIQKTLWNSLKYGPDRKPKPAR